MVAELDKELKMLVKRWEDSSAKIFDVKNPGLVVGEIGRTSALLRDIFNPSFNSIYVNSPEMYQEVRDYVGLIAPDRQNIVKLYKGNAPIFDQFSVERQIKSLFGKTVSFKSGAYLIIEHTEALHVIDVNSGNRSKSNSNQESNALEVNLAAAQEIARQLRLRDMGGIIVVDFIDMQSNENRQKVYEKMKDAMSLDRTKHNILPLSKFGLMQITRQRVRPEMHIETEETCPTCYGSGKRAPAILLPQEIENSVRYAVEKLHLKKMTLRVHPIVDAYLKRGFPSLALNWRFRYSMQLKVVPSDALSFLEYEILDENKKKVSLI
jgi:ribonuclease G